MIKIKMKKLLRSLVIASGGLFIAATASDAASISFTPTGGQLDEDVIWDIETAPDQEITFNVSFNTQFITDTVHNATSDIEIDYSILIDPTELLLLGKPPGQGFRRQVVVSRNSQMVVDPFSVKVLNGLNNNGDIDVMLILHSAYAGGTGFAGENVSNSFGGSGIKQIVEVQPNDPDLLAQNTPEPGTILSAAVALGWGGWLKRKSLSQQNKTNS
jgi:hypothetical protein